MDNTREMEISLTDRATKKLLEIATKEKIDLDSHMLRVAVVPGGCSGLTYELGWDTTVMEDDHFTKLDAFGVLLDQRSVLYIEGSELDFSDGLEGKGFHFVNPNATRSCACGESFGL